MVILLFSVKMKIYCKCRKIQKQSRRHIFDIKEASLFYYKNDWNLHIFLPRTVKDPRKRRYFTSMWGWIMFGYCGWEEYFRDRSGWAFLIINAALPMSLMAQKLLMCEKNRYWSFILIQKNQILNAKKF